VQARRALVYIKWPQMRSYQRNSRVDGHTARSVPVRAAVDIEPAQPSPVFGVVENHALREALAAMNISEMTEIQVCKQP
jgi:hypothetical protein